MFDNIGGKIKGVAKTVTVILIVLSVVYGAVTWKGLADVHQGTLGFVMFLVIGGLGSLAAWLGSLVLYGFGQLIEDASAIRKELVKPAKRMDGPAATPATQLRYAKTAGSEDSAAAGPTAWRCGVCGALNSSSRTNCIKCGCNR